MTVDSGCAACAKIDAGCAACAKIDAGDFVARFRAAPSRELVETLLLEVALAAHPRRDAGDVHHHVRCFEEASTTEWFEEVLRVLAELDARPAAK